MGLSREEIASQPTQQAQAYSAQIKSAAYRLGFSACGLTSASAVPPPIRQEYLNWLTLEMHGSMSYLERNTELRFDPRLLFPGAESIIVVAQNYYPAHFQPNTAPQFAYYAYGRDYHKVVKKKLDKLLNYIQTNIAPHSQGRSFCDSAPLLERYWAVQAGIGWKGKNGLIIIPQAGSYYFLGVLLLDFGDLVYDSPTPSLCGKCQKCLDACPTQALLGAGKMDARRCISYLTIEQSDTIPPHLAQRMGQRIYGCDACQQCCPWNRFACATEEKDFDLRDVLRDITAEQIVNMSDQQFDTLFAGSPIRRAGLSGLRRSLSAITTQPTTSPSYHSHGNSD